MHSFRWKTGLRAACFILTLVLILSLCNYCFFNDSNHRRIMMHEMYTYEPSIDLAFLGGSVAYVHFDPEIWNEELDMRTFNLGSDTQSPDATYFLAKELFKHHSPKYCVFAMSHIGFIEDLIYENPQKDYILFDYFKPSPNKLAYWAHAFDETTKLEAILPFLREKRTISLSSAQNNVKLKRSDEYQNYNYELHDVGFAKYQGDGYVTMEDGKNEGNVGGLFPPLCTEDTIDPMKVDYFKKLVALCKKNDCELIMAVTPIPYAAMGMHDDYQKICDFYAELAKENDVKLFDFALAKPDLFKHEDVDFYDYVHMNGAAAERFSTASSKIIKRYISGKPIDEDALFYGNYQELLDASPYIFNTWLQSTGGGYTAKSTCGTGVEPEYRFSVRESEGSPWKCLYEYGETDVLSIDCLPENTMQIKLEARPRGSAEECQQYDILEF